jgi:hypothetical protein
VGDAFRITKQNKILAEHATFHWCFGKVCVPEIDKHLIRPPEIRRRVKVSGRRAD